jgi:hypothetical protein
VKPSLIKALELKLSLVKALRQMLAGVLVAMKVATRHVLRGQRFEGENDLP